MRVADSILEYESYYFFLEGYDFETGKVIRAIRSNATKIESHRQRTLQGFFSYKLLPTKLSKIWLGVKTVRTQSQSYKCEDALFYTSFSSPTNENVDFLYSNRFFQKFYSLFLSSIKREILVTDFPYSTVDESLFCFQFQ